MNQIQTIKLLLGQSRTQSSVQKAAFFKTGPGEYGAHDQFIGVPNPILRRYAKQFKALSLEEIHELLESPINEERLLALFILVHQYERGDAEQKENIYSFYRDHLRYINNWNLVDASAHLIVGSHLFQKSSDMLITLAHSKSLWERRVAIVATWYFIRNDSTKKTFDLAKILMNDPEDLIHKAVGWMLREAGKRNQASLEDFLRDYAGLMPRTMLRYAIEKFAPEQRKHYLQAK